MHAENLYAERALKAGAKGYVQKQESPELLLKAIRNVLADKIFISEELNAKILEKSFEGRIDKSDSPEDILSDREFEVFCFIGQGFKPQRIAEELKLSPNTIENYRMHIREKLHLKNAAELSRHAIEWCWNHKLHGSE